VDVDILDFTGCKIALFCGDKILTILRDDKENIPWPCFLMNIAYEVCHTFRELSYRV